MEEGKDREIEAAKRERKKGRTRGGETEGVRRERERKEGREETEQE